MHYYVLGLNDSSTEDDTKKAYRSLDLLFQPDKNKHSQASDVMLMINEANKYLKDTFCYNDAMREQESVRMAQNYIIISSDDESDSGIREIPSKPVTSSNKASTFTAEHKSDNEGTPLGKNHQGPFTLKQETL